MTTVAPTIPVAASAYSGTFHLRAASAGGLVVAIPDDDSTVLALYGPDGAVRPGWPVRFAGHGCRTANIGSDGAIRVVCTVADGKTRAYAFDAAGHSLKGWPVDIAAFTPPMAPPDPVVIGTRLVVLVTDDLNDIPGLASVASIAADGRLARGAPVPFPDWTGWWALGPDGTAYRAHYEGTEGDLPSSTRVLAFDGAGARPGWPIEISGMASSPTFGPGGRIRLLRGRVGGSPTEVLEVTPPRVSVVTSLATPLGGAWAGAGAPLFPAPAIGASDGGLFIVSGGIGRGSGVTAAAITSDGSARPGWPHGDDAVLAASNACGPDSSGCSWFRAAPVAGPDGSLYLLEMTSGSNGRGRIVAVGVDGRTRAGWPVMLSRDGAAFWSAVISDSGTVYALAVEPEGERTASATILAIAPNGSVTWKRTVEEP